MNAVEIQVCHIDLIDQLADDLKGVAGCLHALGNSDGPFAEKAEHLLSVVVEERAKQLCNLSKLLNPMETSV